MYLFMRNSFKKFAEFLFFFSFTGDSMVPISDCIAIDQLFKAASYKPPSGFHISAYGLLEFICEIMHNKKTRYLL